MSRRLTLYGAAFVAICLVLSSCGAVRGERVVSGVATDGDQTVQQPVPTRNAGSAIEVNNVSEAGAFNFVSSNLDGAEPLSGIDLVSGGPVIMTFVVPQCPVCISEAPTLAQSAAQHPEVTYVMVHSGGTTADYRDFNLSSGLNLANVVHLDDSAGYLWARFGVIQQPTNLFIDSGGAVSQSLGALSAEDLEQVVGGL